MKKIKFYFKAHATGLLLLVLPLLLACGVRKGRVAASADVVAADSSLVSPHYAEGFKVRCQADGVRLVDIVDPQHSSDDEGALSTQTCHVALVPRGVEAAVPEGYTVVSVPIEHCILMTTLQLSGFIALDALDYVSGMTSTKSLKNADVRKRIDDGRIVKIGIEGNFDSELVMAARPDVIFISPFKRGGYEVLTESGITLIPHLGYKENSALGQTEWIKFIGMFVGMERQANEYFAQVEQQYNKVKAMADSVSVRPTVMSGEMHGGQWYAVGGRNSLAQMFRDAGADYVLHDNAETGGVTLDFEEHYARAANADFWRILNAYDGDFSYDALLQSDARNADFNAFRKHQVVYCNMKQTAYYELAPMHPDQLLEDFVFAFHPSLLPKDYQPHFYQLLK